MKSKQYQIDEHVQQIDSIQLFNYKQQVITLKEYTTWERAYEKYLNVDGVYKFPSTGVEMVWVLARNYYSTFDESYRKRGRG